MATAAVEAVMDLPEDCLEVDKVDREWSVSVQSDMSLGEGDPCTDATPLVEVGALVALFACDDRVRLSTFFVMEEETHAVLVLVLVLVCVSSSSSSLAVRVSVWGGGRWPFCVVDRLTSTCEDEDEGDVEVEVEAEVEVEVEVIEVVRTAP